MTSRECRRRGRPGATCRSSRRYGSRIRAADSPRRWPAPNGRRRPRCRWPARSCARRSVRFPVGASIESARPSEKGSMVVSVVSLRTARLVITAIPAQIVHPVGAADLSEAVPGLRAVDRLVPGAIGQAGDAQIGSGEMLGRAQRIHAGAGQPRSFLPLGASIEDQDVDDALPLQPEGDRQSGETGADDDDIMDGGAFRPAACRNPRPAARPRCGPGRP